MKETFSFVWKLAILSPLLYVLPALGLELSFFRSAITANVYEILSFLGFSVKQSGTLLFLGDNSISITRDCVPWKVMLFFVSLNIASKTSGKSKIYSVLLFLPILYFYNIGRIVALSYTSFFGVSAFHMMHAAFQLVSIAFAIYFWIRFSKSIS